MTSLLVLVPLNFLLAGGLTFIVNWLAAIPWRRAAGAHWTERARLLWPVRKAAAVNIYLIPACLLLSEVETGLWVPSECLVSAIAGFLGAILGRFPLDREINPRFTFRGWLHLASVSWALRLGFVTVLLGSAFLMPDQLGFATLVISGCVLLFFAAWNWGLGLRVLRRTGILRDPGARLKGGVADMAQRMGMREPATWLMDVPLACAFASPNTGELMVSTRLLEISSDKEIAVVCAHELAHLTESKSVRAGRMAGSMTLFPVIFARPAMHFGPSAGCALLGLIWLSAGLTQKLSRRMENRADKIAAENQVEAGIYACALEKLYCDNLMPAVTPSNSQAHPHLYDRMLAAGIKPQYPRPAKPEKMAWSGALFWTAITVLLVIAVTK